MTKVTKVTFLALYLYIYIYILRQIDDENGMITDLDDCLEENVYSELFDCSYIDENCLLGYPVFTQYDPRTDMNNMPDMTRNCSR